MKKRLISLCMVLVLMLSVCLMTALPVSAHPDEAATLTAPTRTLDVGATFNVPITITQTGDPKGLNCALFDIKVTENKLTLNYGANATLTDGWFVTVGPKVNAGGYDTWTIETDPGNTSNVTGDGTIVVLNFTALGGFLDTESTALDLLNVSLSDSSSNAITPTPVDGLATVAELKVTAATVTGSNTANNEGYVTASDEHTTFTLGRSITGGSGTYTAYAWSFGADGTGTTTASTPSDVVYSTAGTKTITLTVTDDDGSTSTWAAGSVTAIIYNNLVADFSGTTGTAGHLQEGIAKPSGAGYVSTTNYPTTVAFTPNNSGGKGPYVYTGTAGWDYNGDMTIDSHETSPSFDYSTIVTFPGTDGEKLYNVILNVKDSLVASDAKSQASYITIWRAGNVNMDASLDAADLTKLRGVVVHSWAATWTSDVNDDTVVNAQDITKLLIYLS